MATAAICELVQVVVDCKAQDDVALHAGVEGRWKAWCSLSVRSRGKLMKKEWCDLPGRVGGGKVHTSPAEVLARLSGPTLCQDGAPDCDLPGGLIPEQVQVEEDDTGRHWQGSHQSL